MKTATEVVAETRSDLARVERPYAYLLTDDGVIVVVTQEAVRPSTRSERRWLRRALADSGMDTLAACTGLTAAELVETG